MEPAPIVDRSHSRTMFVYKDVETPTVTIFNGIFIAFSGLLQLIGINDRNLIFRPAVRAAVDTEFL